MRAVIQRVRTASVGVVMASGVEKAADIGRGYLILVGVRHDDSDEDARYLAQKAATLRIFPDDAGKLNLSLVDVAGAALVVSNFTLYADCRSGRRPGFSDAARGPEAERLYRLFGCELASNSIPVSYGAFGEEMQVSLINDGPVTVLLDSRKQF